MLTHLQQLRLLQLSSASLPVGSFTYSHGLEWAVEAGWVCNIEQFYQWQIDHIEQSLIQQDLPLLLRLYQAAIKKDLNTFNYWSQYLLACCETLELYSEEIQRGEAMVRILNGLKLKLLPSDVWLALLKRSQSASLAWVGAQWNLPVESLMLSLAWSNLENAVMAGVKLVPFGQLKAQLLMSELSEFVVSQLFIALSISDDDLGSNQPMIAIASACHETQYTRLFRS